MCYKVLICTVLGVLKPSSSENLLELPNICPKIVTREKWGARIPSEVDYGIIPLEYVVVHHTVTEECMNLTECSSLIKRIQNFHMEDMEFHDIGYNFLVGGDGRIYEGTGWHKIGAHTRGYNTKSIGLAFIGNFSEKRPNEKQLKAAKDFLKCAVELGELDPSYKIFGARQVSATESPGLRLYHEIQKWTRFAQTPK